MRALVRPSVRPGVGLALALLGAGAVAQPAPAEAPIAVVCLDGNGRKVITGGSIAPPECAGRDVWLRYRNGREVLVRAEKSLPAREADEARARKALEEYQDCNARALQERNLLLRYPTRAGHDATRLKETAPVESTIAYYEKRLAELDARRRKLLDELEFYPPPLPVPARLQQAIDDNQALREAQVRLIAQRQDELKTINARRDGELARLDALWAGRTTRCVMPS